MKSAQIAEITGEFDNVLRLSGGTALDPFLLDIYVFNEERNPKVGDFIDYRFFDATTKFPEDLPKIGTVMNGKVYKLQNELNYISFGGLLGLFKINGPNHLVSEGPNHLVSEGNLSSVEGGTNHLVSEGNLSIWYDIRTKC